jgi:Tol biopolymer transport system component
MPSALSSPPYFSPDGKRLATASKDESLQIYVLYTAGLMHLSRKRITRKRITRSECQEYFQTATCPPLP